MLELNDLCAEYGLRGYQFLFPDAVEEQNMKTKTVLLLTHQLSRTGAPLALFTMAQVLNSTYRVVVASVEDGDLKEDYLCAGILVINIGRYWERKHVFKSFAKHFDAVIANTVLNFPAVMLLDGSELSVFWWIHEHENYFSYGRGEIPNPHTLKDNIHVLVAGAYVQNVMREEFSYEADILNVGVVDVCCEVDNVDKRGIIELVSVGTYGLEKGQDILVRAYECLPKSYRERIALTFVGNDKEKDDAIYDMVQTLSRKEPLVHVKPLMPKDKIMRLYQQSDGVIVPSRLDVLSMVAVENMMLGKCVLVSTGTGIASYIEDGKNGYIFEKENAQALADCMIRMVDNAEHLQSIGECARRVYEKHFSMLIFREKIAEKILDLIER